MNANRNNTGRSPATLGFLVAIVLVTSATFMACSTHAGSIPTTQTVDGAVLGSQCIVAGQKVPCLATRTAWDTTEARVCAPIRDAQHALYPEFGYVDSTSRLTCAQRVLTMSGPQWQIAPIDSFAVAGGCAMAEDSLLRPMVSYQDRQSGNLMFAHRVGAVWVRETVDASRRVGNWTSIARVQGGVGIAYRDSVRDSLQYAEKIGAGAWNITAVAQGGEYPSLIAEGSLRAISYRNDHLGVADLRLSRRTGGTWSTSIADSRGGWNGPAFTSLVGRPSLGQFGIAYFDLTGLNLDYAFTTDTTHTWTVQPVDTVGDVGRFCSTAEFGASPATSVGITYYDRTLDHLKYAQKEGAAWVLSVQDSVGGFTACSASAAPGDTIGIAYSDRAGQIHYQWHANTVEAVSGATAAARFPIEWLRRSGGGGRIRFAMPAAGSLLVTVLDAQGRAIATLVHESASAGAIEVPWNGRDARGRRVDSGVYFVRVVTPFASAAIPAVVLR